MDKMLKTDEYGRQRIVAPEDKVLKGYSCGSVRLSIYSWLWLVG